MLKLDYFRYIKFNKNLLIQLIEPASFYFLNMAASKFYISYVALVYSSHYISIGRCWCGQQGFFSTFQITPHCQIGLEVPLAAVIRIQNSLSVIEDGAFFLPKDAPSSQLLHPSGVDGQPHHRNIQRAQLRETRLNSLSQAYCPG